MMLWVVALAAGLAFWVLLGMVLPRPRNHWQNRLRRAAIRGTARVHRRPTRPPDPFEALHVQSRLGALAGELRRVEADPAIYAKMHRLVALRTAYDDLLDEGCRLAGVPARPGGEKDEERRWREEQELAERGWSW